MVEEKKKCTFFPPDLSTEAKARFFFHFARKGNRGREKKRKEVNKSTSILDAIPSCLLQFLLLLFPGSIFGLEGPERNFQPFISEAGGGGKARTARGVRKEGVMK